MTDEMDRRDVLKGAAAAFTTALFTGRVHGANDRLLPSATSANRSSLVLTCSAALQGCRRADGQA
jgi:hypothetical protein